MAFLLETAGWIRAMPLPDEVRAPWEVFGEDVLDAACPLPNLKELQALGAEDDVSFHRLDSAPSPSKES